MRGSEIKPWMAGGAALGGLVGAALFLVVDPEPAGCDGLLMGAIHCLFVPIFGLMLAAGTGACVGALIGAIAGWRRS